jgi:hypothetical protein
MEERRSALNKAFDRLKRFWNDHPVETIIIGIAAAGAAAKLMDANTNRRNSRSWEREVDRRRSKQRYPFN